MIKKIIFLGKTPPPYIGPAIAAQIILNSDLSKRHRLIHLDTSDHRAFNTLGKIDPGNFFFALKQYFILFYLLIKHRPQAVYIPSQQTTIGYLRDVPFIILTKLFRKKVICHLRGGNFKNWYNNTNRFMQWVVRKTQKKIDGQIVLGECLRPMFTDFMDARKIHVVPNGGNYSIPEVEEKTEALQIVYLGNFIETKGVMDAIRAIGYLDGAKCKLVCAGSFNDAAFEKRVRNEIAEKNLPVEILLPVSGEEKFRLLKQSDIFIFPTYYPNEGHPWVIIEAMACGLPVISTHHAAIPETVFDGVNGFLVEKQDPKHMTEKIQYLMDNPDILKKMGEESLRMYKEHFTEEIMIDKLDKAFEQILK